MQPLQKMGNGALTTKTADQNTTTAVATAPIIQQLQIEANKPSDLSDLMSNDLTQTLAELTRLRTLLRDYTTDTHYHLFDTRPPAFQTMTLPIPTPEELLSLLDSQIASKKILEARRKREK